MVEQNQYVNNSSIYDSICWNGDWRYIPRTCGGLIEVWDQTIGCSECGMNIWYLPDRDKWPEWDAANAPAVDHWEAWKANKTSSNPYDVFVNLFSQIHLFQFNDCHDPGDEDRTESDLWTLGP